MGGILISDSKRLMKYFLQYDRAWVYSLIAVVFLVYLPFLGNPFVFDDVYFFYNSERLQAYASSLFSFDLRWLPYASLGWTAVLFSEEAPHLFHLGNMLIHGANVILLFYLLRQITEAAITKYVNTNEIMWGAWLGALIFACHPVAVYAVGYIVQRSILMAAFFGFLMYWAYLRSALSGEKRWLVLSLVSCYFAAFSKEHSVLLPLALAALAFLLRDSNKLSKQTLRLTWAVFLLIFVLVILRAKGVFGLPYEALAANLFDQQGIVASTPMLHVLSVMTQAGLFFKYLFLWILPNPAWMSVDMREQFIPVWTAWQGWLGIIAFSLYGMFAIRMLLRGGRQGLLGFALLYPWVMFLIEFSSIRVQEPFVLYRSYLWIPGLMLLMPLLLIKLPDRRLRMVLILSVLLLVPLAWNRLWTFEDNYRLWNDAALLLPNNTVVGADRIYFNRGQAAEKEENWDAAADDFERAMVNKPQFSGLHYSLGKAYLKLERFEEALAQFEAGIKIKPDEGRQYFGKGLALLGLKHPELAKQQMKKACELGEQVGCMMNAWMKSK